MNVSAAVGRLRERREEDALRRLGQAIKKSWGQNTNLIGIAVSNNRATGYRIQKNRDVWVQTSTRSVWLERGSLSAKIFEYRILLAICRLPLLWVEMFKIKNAGVFQFKTRILIRVTDHNYGDHVANNVFVEFLHEGRVRFLASLGYAEKNLEGLR